MRLTSNPNHDDRERRLEPLPGDFSPELEAIDERLAELAARAVGRSGLSQRVFAASVEKLPATVGGNRSLRFVDRFWGGRQAWGQFAMAASVALVFGIAWWFVQGPHTNPINNVAVNNNDVDVSVVTMLGHLPAEQSHLENEFDYLLETSDLTSPDEITSELAMLVREMEM